MAASPSSSADTPQNWAFDTSVAHHSDQDHDAQQVIPVIQRVLSNTQFPHSAARQVSAIYAARVQGDGDSGNSRNRKTFSRPPQSLPVALWEIICSAVEHFAGADEGARHRLVTFLHRLSELSVLDDNGLEIAAASGHVYWRDLPGFELAFRENLCDPCRLLGVIRAGDGPELERARRRFYAANVFTASWMVHIGRERPRREWGSELCLAFSHLRGALEYEVAATSLGHRRAGVWIPQAAQWILIAGPLIYQFCRDRELHDGEPAIFREEDVDGVVDGLLFEGETGYSLQRWEFWMTRFHAVAELNISSDISSLATSAGQRMRDIEEEKG
ncbi:hypothetical protein F5Y15DRAFT_427376 [Xylariaceae sp. FL0016]|nr:hypothetical protein F5Y15DRAFT_427376 [Xylariaceae sp. FL0016]